MIKNVLLSILTLSISVSCKTETQNNQDSRLLSKVQEISSYSSYNPNDNYFTDQEKRNNPYLYLRDSTSTLNLRLLTDHPNPYVKLQSFKALLERSDSSVFSILINHLSDTTKVQISDNNDYCSLNWFSNLSDEMINMSIWQLDTISRDSLRDLIILKYNYLDNTKAILYDLKPVKKYYSTVKKLAIHNYHESAYIALASYQRQDDISIIIKGFNDENKSFGRIFKAIELFPDTAFIPILKEFHQAQLIEALIKHGDGIKYYYQALAKYQRSDLLKLLVDLNQRKYFNNDFEWETNKKHIFQSLYTYKCPIYQNFYNELEPQIDYQLFEYFEETLPDTVNSFDLPDRIGSMCWWNYP